MFDDDDISESGAGSSVAKGVKFLRTSKEWKLLNSWFVSNLIKPTDRPADVKSRHKCFAKFTSSQFRSQFNKLKKEHGLVTRVGVKQHHKATVKKTDGDDDEEMEESDERAADEDTDDVVTSSTRQTTAAALWTQKRLLATYSNTDGIRCCTVIFALTGGATVEDTDDVEVNVVDGGNTLAITEEYTKMMTDMEEFYSLFPHDKQQQSDDDFNKMRFAMMDAARLSNDDDSNRKATYYERLPFKVDPTEIRTTYTGLKDGSRFVHVELAERKKLRVQSVVMMDKGRSNKTTKKAVPTKYSNLPV